MRRPELPRTLQQLSDARDDTALMAFRADPGSRPRPPVRKRPSGQGGTGRARSRW
ncbi:hypothetical protein ACFY8K_30480 [Streptomyces misionensis]|uniref:hypothetical protein n=1 Tax=Streptomyces misionensis TaxID=67331 RepID=UPI00368F9870